MGNDAIAKKTPRFLNLHTGIAINAGMKGGGVGSPIFHVGSQAMIQMSWSIAFGIGEHSGGGCMTVLITATHDEDGQCLEMKEIIDGDRVVSIMGSYKTRIKSESPLSD